MPNSLSAAEHDLLFLNNAGPGHSVISKAACEADARTALTSELARRLFVAGKDAHSFFGVDWSKLAPQDSLLDVLSLAVAAVNAFCQVNWTGPALELGVEEVLGCSRELVADLNQSAVEALAYAGEPSYHLAHVPVFLVLALQILGLLPARTNMERALNEIKMANAYSGPASGWGGLQTSIALWRLRAGIVWLRVLDEPALLPFYVTKDAEALDLTDPEEGATVSLSLSLLQTLLAKSSSHSAAFKEAYAYSKRAAEQYGLHWQLTGRLGKRTKWQETEKTQLVVLACDSDGTASAPEPASATHIVPSNLELNDDTLLEHVSFSKDAGAVDADSDAVLKDLDPANQPSISALSQSILLSLSILTMSEYVSLEHVSEDQLSTSQIMAFAERVLRDQRNWSVFSMALLLRSRAEAGRSRTVERGLLQIQALVDQLRDGLPQLRSSLSAAVKDEDVAPARDRLMYIHALALPPWWEMERELASRYLNIGIVKSALDIFTRLEMWEQVAECWTSLERRDRGIEIIKSMLEGSKTESEMVMLSRKGVLSLTNDDVEEQQQSKTEEELKQERELFQRRRSLLGQTRMAKLWCTLGELENDKAHYEKAWEVSGHRSSRAQRSLGAIYWGQGDFERARDAFRLALRINSLYGRTWYILGCCEMRLENFKAAQEAFARVIALEDDNAEAWSNLASCHLRLGETEGDEARHHSESESEDAAETAGDDTERATERLPFSRKRAAFQCLKQATKYARDGRAWRVWENYMIICVDVGEMSEACRALTRMVEIKKNTNEPLDSIVDLDVLNRLTDAVTRGDDGASGNEWVDPNYGKGLAPRLERLIDDVILTRDARIPRVWRVKSRLQIFKQDWKGALESALSAYRVSPASDTITDVETFRDACEQVREVVDMLENMGPKTDKETGEEVEPKWKFKARTTVRSFLGRTRDMFEGEREYGELNDLLSELK